MSFFRSADGSWKPIQGVRLIKTQSYHRRSNSPSRQSVELPIKSEIKRKPDNKKQELPRKKIKTMNKGLKNGQNMAIKKKKSVKSHLKAVKEDLNQDQKQIKIQGQDQERQQDQDQDPDQDKNQDKSQEQDLENDPDFEQDLL